MCEAQDKQVVKVFYHLNMMCAETLYRAAVIDFFRHFPSIMWLFWLFSTKNISSSRVGKSLFMLLSVWTHNRGRDLIDRCSHGEKEANQKQECKHQRNRTFIYTVWSQSSESFSLWLLCIHTHTHLGLWLSISSCSWINDGVLTLLPSHLYLMFSPVPWNPASAINRIARLSAATDPPTSSSRPSLFFPPSVCLLFVSLLRWHRVQVLSLSTHMKNKSRFGNSAENKYLLSLELNGTNEAEKVRCAHQCFSSPNVYIFQQIHNAFW